MAGKRGGSKGGGSGKIAALAATFVAGTIARKIITAIWKKVTGNEPPTDPHDPDIELKEALGWSIVMGIAMESARLLAARAVAARITHKSAEAAGQPAE
jgi:Protein of unknown function (DUF4235)